MKSRALELTASFPANRRTFGGARANALLTQVNGRKIGLHKVCMRADADLATSFIDYPRQVNR